MSNDSVLRAFMFPSLGKPGNYSVVTMLVALFCFLVPSAQAKETLRIYIVPQFSAEEIFRTWSPVLKKAGDYAGINFVLKTAKSIPEFETMLAEGEPDIAYLNPYHAIMAKKRAGYEPIIYDVSETLTGILVVRKDALITGLRQLEGKDIAFPAPNAFGASLYMRALLFEKERLAFTPKYVSTHTNVFRQVLSGQAAAGGAIRQTLQKESPELQAQLEILYETPPTISHPIVIHPRFSGNLKKRIQQAFLALGDDPQAAAILQQVQLRSPKIASYANYQHLEQLGLEKFVVQAPVTK